MTNERHEAFIKANDIMDRLGPSKLQPEEESLLRDAAEGLLLCGDPECEEAEDYRRNTAAQLEVLVHSGRWLEDTARMLAAAIQDCCPVPVPA